MLRGSGLLRSVLITVLELAHVHAGRASGLAPQPPQRELEAKRDTRTHTVTHAARTWLAPLGVGRGTWPCPRARGARQQRPVSSCSLSFCFCFLGGGAAAVPAVFFAVGTWLMAVGEVQAKNRTYMRCMPQYI